MRRLLYGLLIFAAAPAVAWALVRAGEPLVPVGVFVWLAVLVSGGLMGAWAFETVWRLRGPWRAVALVPLVAVGVAGILMLPFTPLLAGDIANEVRLGAFASRIGRLPPPPGATVVTRTQDVGLLAGNGDHCDFVVTVVLKAPPSLSLRHVHTHYDGFEIEPANAGARRSRRAVRVEPSRAEPPAPGAGSTVEVRFADTHYPATGLNCG